VTDLINPPARTRHQLPAWLLIGAVVAGALLRLCFLTADPPTHATVGIVWHDEGAWTHNARNKALFGEWSLDAWNPVFIAPIFTAAEYVAFALFGVGLWQARVVPVVLGLLSIPLLACGVTRIAGSRAGTIAGVLLATNYVYVMWNRAALMEGPMTAFIVAAWYCYVRAEQSPRWAWGAAAFALVAFFTKAAAVFFVGALGLDALALLLLGRRYSERPGAAALPALLALAVCGTLAFVTFVLPNWADYRFYNWQMSVTRKPSYDVASLVNRLTWFPILHDLFTRMWFALVVGIAATLAALTRWRGITAGERLLVLWIFVGALELLVHDVGNERRFVFFIPALIGLTAVVLGSGRPLIGAMVPRQRALLAAPLVAYAAYVGIGALVRVLFLYEVRPNVRLAAGAAVVVTAGMFVLWPRVGRWLASTRVDARAAAVLTMIVVLGDVLQYGQWAVTRTHKNVEASRQLGARLAPGTLVHGKLANGLALENHIRPIFVGHGFGNFDDRRSRDDVRYILTYVAPCVGFEGSQIHDVLDAYPNRSIIMTFDVAESPGGRDRAALIDKFGGAADRLGEPCDRAQD
jgi:4-amino-4-deoxy-L-arabinose transferase-like glycosyltransferase